ncbi:DUF1501 domain-containing protein [Nocardioides sp. GY 10127]|uniref:DUF1501 domain-containing protein n=1 Tax=Nocardioides sp. GY 10127 TaxID=2569762 RepID=UPI0010A7F159|nr:DUF1501 domain-containing protein [Nocardioides sp. GY 10127]TIC84406.1 DUF1501 domain-containing protein [Nocardioides sp. GY 10127]
MTSPHRSACCSELADATALTRRGVLRGLGVAGLTYAVGSAVVQASPALAVAAGERDGTVVVLSLRGAADGLSLVVPHGDPVYAAARPRIAVPTSSLLASDGFFGLHPELEPLLPYWQAGSFAAVHATGLPAPNRSHFSAMEEVEDANPGSTERIGWLNRLLGDLPGSGTLQGVAVGDETTQIFGPEAHLSFSSLDDAVIAGDDEWDPTDDRLRSLRRMWGRSKHPLASSVRHAMGAVANLQAAKDVPAGTAYPDTDLARALSTVARTIKGDVGARVFTVDQGDWDMHTDLGTLSWGGMRTNARRLSAALAAFMDDLGDAASRTTVVVLSEFGRRVKENANYGLDHGWGNVMLLLGAGVRGGSYYGTWPGLANTTDADLTVTTDYRSVLAEVVTTRTSASAATVFPGFTPETVGAMTSL